MGGRSGLVAYDLSGRQAATGRPITDGYGALRPCLLRRHPAHVGDHETILRFDGTRWSVVSANPRTPARWDAVGVAANGDVWVAGPSGRMRRINSGGTVSSALGSTSNQLRDLQAIAGELWLTGSEGTWRLASTGAWTQVSSQGGDQLAGTSSTDVRLLADGIVQRWGGTAFRSVNHTVLIDTVASFSTSNTVLISRTAAFRWNGSQLSRETRSAEFTRAAAVGTTRASTSGCGRARRRNCGRLARAVSWYVCGRARGTRGRSPSGRCSRSGVTPRWSACRRPASSGGRGGSDAGDGSSLHRVVMKVDGAVDGRRRTGACCAPGVTPRGNL
jgi:hypothetical protein